MPPFKNQAGGRLAAKWRDHVEFIRKDLECVFGILKKGSRYSNLQIAYTILKAFACMPNICTIEHYTVLSIRRSCSQSIEINAVVYLSLIQLFFCF